MECILTLLTEYLHAGIRVYFAEVFTRRNFSNLFVLFYCVLTTLWNITNKVILAKKEMLMFLKFSA